MVTLLRIYQQAEKNPAEVSAEAAWDYTRSALVARNRLRESANRRHG
jgi:hypothetical protein